MTCPEDPAYCRNDHVKGSIYSLYHDQVEHTDASGWTYWYVNRTFDNRIWRWRWEPYLDVHGYTLWEKTTLRKDSIKTIKNGNRTTTKVRNEPI